MIIKWFKKLTGQYVETSVDDPFPVQIISSGGGGGATEVNISGTGGSADTADGSSDTNATTQIGMVTNSRMQAYDGTNFRRVQADTNGNLKMVIENAPKWQGVNDIVDGEVNPTNSGDYPKLIDLSSENATGIWIQAPESNTVPLRVTNLSGNITDGGWVYPGTSEWFYFSKVYVRVDSGTDIQALAYQGVRYG